jgi:hypothetical protein
MIFFIWSYFKRLSDPKRDGIENNTKFNPPATDEGLIPRPLGRLKFSD